jgi:hypothetical protein
MSTNKSTRRKSSRIYVAMTSAARQTRASPTAGNEFHVSHSEDEANVFKQRNSTLFHIPEAYKLKMDEGIKEVFDALALTPAEHDRVPCLLSDIT